MENTTLEFQPIFIVRQHATEYVKAEGILLNKFRNNSYGNLHTYWLIKEGDIFYPEVKYETDYVYAYTRIYTSEAEALDRLVIEKQNHIKSIEDAIVRQQEKIKELQTK